MRSALVALSALLYTLAFPPWGYGLVAFIALVPLLVALKDVGVGRAAGYGLLWGTLTIWGLGYWVPVSMSTYWGQPLWFGVLFSLISSAIFMGLYGAGFAASAALIQSRFAGTARVALLACAWIAWEVARGRLLTGDPWLLLGYALGPYSLLTQIADLGAVYAISFVVALMNGALADTVSNRRDSTRAPLWLAGTMLAMSVAYGAYRLQESLPPSPPRQVRLVQANNDPGTQWEPAQYGAGLDRYLELTKQDLPREQPQVVIWPESAVTFFLAREPAYQQLIRDAAAQVGADFLLGAPHFSDRDPARPEYFNSAFYLTRDGVMARYDKVHLMPFGEYFPLRTIQFLRRNFERVRSFTPGTTPALLDTALGRTAVVICFEAIFPELVRERMAAGGEVLVNLSNDAWLGDNAGPRQHALMVAMRAIETRSWVVRATTTGLSSIIDPWGRTTAVTEIGVAATIDGTVAPLNVETLYERSGDLFSLACVIITGATMIATLWRRRIRLELPT